MPDTEGTGSGSDVSQVIVNRRKKKQKHEDDEDATNQQPGDSCVLSRYAQWTKEVRIYSWTICAEAVSKVLHLFPTGGPTAP